jgi:hypothetical protein
MKHLLNTLFVTLEDAYAALDGENVVVKQGGRWQVDFPCIFWRIFICSPMPERLRR